MSWLNASPSPAWAASRSALVTAVPPSRPVTWARLPGARARRPAAGSILRAQAGEVLDEGLEVKAAPVGAHVLVHLVRHSFLVDHHLGGPVLIGQGKPDHRVDARLPVGEPPGLGDPLVGNQFDLASFQPPVEQREVCARGAPAL